MKIYAEEAQRFIASDPDTQAFMRRSGLMYGTDELGYLLNSRGEPSNEHISHITGNTPGAIAAERRAEERITQLENPLAVPEPERRLPTGFESPEEEPFGATKGRSLQAAYQSETERKPWIAQGVPETGLAGIETAGEERPPEGWAGMADVTPPAVVVSEQPVPASASPAPAPQAQPSGAPAAASPTLRRYYELSDAAQRTRREHGQTEIRLKQGIRKTFILIIACALFCAALADFLSILDLGWLVSWSIPLFTGMMLSRMNSIRKSEQAIIDERTSVRRDITVARQRLQQLGVRRTESIGQPGPLSNAKSYVGTYIRDTIAVQLVELIPLVDILPMYSGQVVKMILNQNSTYRKALTEFRVLEGEHRVLQALQRAEIAAIRRRILPLLVMSRVVEFGRALA